METKTKILGLRTTIYHVPDVDEAKKWYSKAFLTEPYFDQPFYVGFNVGGYELGLQPEGDTFSARTDNVVTYWGVENIEDEYKRFLSLGASAHHLPQDVGENIIVATVKDPWGNAIGLIFNPHFKLP